MKKILPLGIMIFACYLVQAQVGVIGAYKSFKADKWAKTIYPSFGGSSSVLYGYNVGVDYWFRLKNKRIEFTPEVSYETYEDEIENGALSHRLLNFHFNTNFYLLDFNSDCNCPTWSKTGNIFTKGFFLQLSPGVSWIRNNIEDSFNPDIQEGKTVAFVAGVGAGLDIGISEHLTLTPIVKFYYFPDVFWSWEITSPGSSTSIQQIYAGLKLGFRFKKERRF